LPGPDALRPGARGYRTAAAARMTLCPVSAQAMDERGRLERGREIRGSGRLHALAELRLERGVVVPERLEQPPHLGFEIERERRVATRCALARGVARRLDEVAGGLAGQEHRAHECAGRLEVRALRVRGVRHLAALAAQIRGLFEQPSLRAR